MGDILLPISFLKAYSSIAIIFAITLTIVYGFKKDLDYDIKELLFAILKCVGYSVLAIVMYQHYIGLDKIPILDFFTFTLATYEGSHNFVNFFGVMIFALRDIKNKLTIH